jgi:glycosyltransferase involved in cell wall biosynthesis
MPRHNRVQGARVLLLTDVTQPGGVGTHLVNLASKALAEGFMICVAVEDSPAAAVLVPRLRQLGVAVVRERLHRSHPVPAVQNAIQSLLTDFRPDLVHVHCGSPRSALLPRELILETGLPLIFTEHFVAPDIEISSAEHVRISCVYRQASAVITVSENNRRLLTGHFDWEAQRLVLIRYGVRLTPDTTRPCLRPCDPVKALTVARLVQQKGLDVLLSAARRLPEAIKARMHFTIAGSGDQEAKLRSYARHLGIEASVSFLGWRDDVEALLQSHNLFILPSRAEGEPIALLEALVAGLPCIASAVSGIPESLAQGRFGDLVAPNDPDALSASITRFVCQPNVLYGKASHARTYLAEQYDLDTSLQAILDLWCSRMLSRSAKGF